MVRSMTAFARQECQGDWGALTLELRSVNHRYLEVSLRLPDELRMLESAIRERITQALGRGKVDCGLRFQPPGERATALVIDRHYTAQLAQLTREIDGLLYNPAPVSAIEVLKFPGVLQVPQVDPDVLRAEALALLDAALRELIETRAREGAKLRAIIEQRAAVMGEVVAGARARVPEVLVRIRERLRRRLDEVKAELDPVRLEQEMVLVAQKLDVDEELERLQAHLEEVTRVLGQDQPVGRRLDFLMQELNREANTLGAKSADAETTRASVELKVLIEQMREQIQNIE